MDTLTSEGMSFKRPLLKRKAADGCSFKNEAILREFQGPSFTISKRHELYRSTFKWAADHLKGITKKHNADLKKSLEEFIQSADKLVDKDENAIPVGILESGLSVQENTTIFDYIQEKLLDDSKSQVRKVYVTRVQAGTSSSTKAVFQQICRQLTDEHCPEDDSDAPTIKKVAHFSLYDVKRLLQSRHDFDWEYRIVILVDDVDYFQQSIISQLLMLMGCSRLPVIFILGTAHSQFISNLVPSNCSTEFVVQKFYSVSPQARMDDFMKKILFDFSTPFRISGEIAAYLQSLYEEENFSVECIFNCIKFCLRSHFLSEASAFCTWEDFEESQMQAFEEFAKPELGISNTPLKRRKTDATDLLDSVQSNVRTWDFILKFLRVLNYGLPDEPLGKTDTQLYINCYAGYTSMLDENAHFTRLFGALNALSKNDFEDLLEDCVAYLKRIKNQNDIATDFISCLEEALSTLAQDSEKVEDVDVKLKKRLTREELRKTLLDANSRKKGTHGLNAARIKLIDGLKNILKNSFPCFSSLKLAQIYVYSNMNLLINAKFPAIFLRLNEDLTNPSYNLHCDCCAELDSESVDSCLPDTSIIHKLISEQTTKKIDLNHIYQAFVSVVRESPTKRRTSTSAAMQKQADSSYLIRFRKVVGELQHMGFIKRSKSKPDEISRLTWW